MVSEKLVIEKMKSTLDVKVEGEGTLKVPEDTFKSLLVTSGWRLGELTQFVHGESNIRPSMEKILQRPKGVAIKVGVFH